MTRSPVVHPLNNDDFSRFSNILVAGFNLLFFASIPEDAADNDPEKIGISFYLSIKN